MFGADHHAVLDPELALQQIVAGGLPFVAPHLDEEAQPPEVDAQDGDADRGAQVGGAQHGAVPANGNEQVEVVVLDALAQGGIVEQAVESADAAALEVFGDGGGGGSRGGHGGVGGDGDALRDGEEVRHGLIITCVVYFYDLSL